MPANYIISCDEVYEEFYRLLLSRLRDKALHLGVVLDAGRYCGRHYCKLDCGSTPRECVAVLVCDLFSEILLVDFKHIYFKKNLNINISDKNLSDVFYSSVTLYDREYDEELLNIRAVSDRELAVDSLIRFCTGDLSLRWMGVSQILCENFYGGRDKDAIMEFIKHIVYSVPAKTAELNVFRREIYYHFIDENGKNVATVLAGEGDIGEMAASVMFNLPARINFYDAPDTQGMRFLKQIFSDKIHFSC